MVGEFRVEGGFLEGSRPTRSAPSCQGDAANRSFPATTNTSPWTPSQLSGKPGAYTALCQSTDGALPAKAVEWMATDPKCANQAFNITNSDLVRWQACGPSSPTSSGWCWRHHGSSTLRRPWRTRGRSWERSSNERIGEFRFCFSACFRTFGASGSFLDLPRLRVACTRATP